jgi:hypothetical protein
LIQQFWDYVDAEPSCKKNRLEAPNPVFHDGGLARKQFIAAKAVLKVPDMLRSLSWQSLLDHLETFEELAWLTGQLRAKYGF